ncbi:GNAT family N-acetyltransferase [Ectobacillus antri]|uniref:GNAT family N-acetyltransferase n=1 Tax=Ectobacillus antri TaxID=2486280 RepID=A0ABT6H5M2_9BACI|nr:GNAT family N-acetyltransferase [Ectobacillus antri]MDG4658063.1 GNAT family N-acetyltransferase [Ectobacillus antri]MDG5753696.1 GNAT family N-acetyltransferase [Ectobacillus antri]
MIRSIRFEDAKAYAALLTTIEAETDFLLYGAGERNMTEVQATKMIESFLNQESANIFVVEEQERLVGFLMLMGGKAPRQKHTAHIAIGLLQSHVGKGWGKFLFQEAEAFAKTVGITRLELTVMKHNEAAISLYKKVGFGVEGLRKQSLLINGQYVDEYSMAKLL